MQHLRIPSIASIREWSEPQRQFLLISHQLEEARQKGQSQYNETVARLAAREQQIIADREREMM